MPLLPDDPEVQQHVEARCKRIPTTTSTTPDIVGKYSTLPITDTFKIHPEKRCFLHGETELSYSQVPQSVKDKFPKDNHGRPNFQNQLINVTFRNRIG